MVYGELQLTVGRQQRSRVCFAAYLVADVSLYAFTAVSHLTDVVFTKMSMVTSTTPQGLVCPKRDYWNIDFEKGELHYDNQVNYDQRKYAWMFSGFIACIFWLLRIATMKY